MKTLNINAIHTTSQELAQTLNSMNLSGYNEVRVLINEDNSFCTYTMNPKVRWFTVDEIDVEDFSNENTLILGRPTDVKFALDKCRAELREARRESVVMQEYEDLYKKWDESQCYPKIRSK